MKKIICIIALIVLCSFQKTEEKNYNLKEKTYVQLQRTLNDMYDYLKKRPFEEAAPLIQELVALQQAVNDDLKIDSTRKK